MSGGEVRPEPPRERPSEAFPASPVASTPEPTPEPTPEREVGLQEVLELANRLQREQRYGEAEAIYLQVLQQLPEEANTLHFLGVLRHQQGRNDEALALLERAIGQLPGEPGVWVNLATC